MFDRRYLAHFDWWLLLIVCLLMVVGFINLNSASTAAGYPFQWRQLQWYVLGSFVMLVLLFRDYRFFAAYTVHLYLGAVLLLGLVLFFGKSAGGSQRWLSFGFMSVQPSEFAKLIIVIVLSSYFYHDDRRSYRLCDLWRPAVLVGVLAWLIYRQPDLGTALLLVAIFASVVYMARPRWTSVLMLISWMAAIMPLAWKLLKPYQRERVKILFNPESDPLHAGYQVIQSKIAIGSGQVWGRGYRAGSQAQLNFLPEIHTDFAFAVWAEEWGFIGSIILLSLYFALLYRGLVIAAQSRERFGAYVAFGVTAMLFWQIVVNIGMTLGLVPVVGIPLPLISYGGSSVLTTLVGVGLLLNIRMRRFVFQ
jgi:rod shape determining protein RodA